MVRMTILVYLSVHALGLLACMSEAYPPPSFSMSVNQPWLHFEPPPNKPMRTWSAD